MPDTGAPWNIPYVAGTDLVSDWPTDSLALANAIDAGLDAAAGSILQLVNTTKTDTWSASISGTTLSGDVTGLTATLTPAAASNLLVVAQVSYGLSTGIGGLVLIRDGNAVAIGDAASNRRVATTTRQGSISGEETEVATIVAFLAASAASSTTFSVRVYNASGSSGNAYVNRSATDSDNANNLRGISTITVAEVRA